MVGREQVVLLEFDALLDLVVRRGRVEKVLTGKGGKVLMRTWSYAEAAASRDFLSPRDLSTLPPVLCTCAVTVGN